MGSLGVGGFVILSGGFQEASLMLLNLDKEMRGICE